MECAQTTWLENAGFFAQFNRKVVEQRIPLSGSLDLTHQCNLRCVHCYVKNAGETQRRSQSELTTVEWFSILDQLAEAGCLTLLLTGGEPLLRKDFVKIYTHAKKNGMFVTVFTNGTLISDDILDVFQTLPPQLIEISLYGATARTYEDITQVPGSYQRCLDGIQRLLDHQIAVRLKTILMTRNRHEFNAMRAIAEDFGVKFRFDAAIFPDLQGNTEPLAFRVAPEEAVEKEFLDTTRMDEWKRFLEKLPDISGIHALYMCGSGRCTFHIDAYGILSPCIMVRNIQYNVRAGDFATGWNEEIPRIHSRPIAADAACDNCQKKAVCGYCPGFFDMEHGSENVRSEYLCAIGQARFQAINNTL